jgi:hypothetical protein
MRAKENRPRPVFFGIDNGVLPWRYLHWTLDSLSGSSTTGEQETAYKSAAFFVTPTCVT